MKCFNCEEPISSGANFCSKCGRDLRAKSNKMHRAEFESRIVGMREDAKKALAEIRLARKRRAKLVAIGGLVLAGVLAAYFLIFYREPLLLIVPVVLFLILTVMLHQYSQHISKAEYKRLPGAVGGDGAIRCVHCGNKGIYKHGEYRSNTIWSDCSKCGETLFTSSKGFG